MPRTLATSAASSAQSVSRKRRRVRRPRPWPLWSKAPTRNLVPSGRPGRHDIEAFTAFFDGADEVALDVVVTFVAHADDTPWLDGFGVDVGDDRGTLEQTAEMADAPFHLALLVFRGVIVAVFGEVT